MARAKNAIHAARQPVVPKAGKVQVGGQALPNCILMQNPLVTARSLRYRTAMSKILLAESIFSALVFSMSLPFTALAQTPVNTSVHLSGSCIKCDLSKRIMPGLSLQGSNFAGSNFANSNLSGAKLDNAILQSANFSKAYLMQIAGKQVDLRGASLSGVTLSEARLQISDFTGADLRKADLTHSDFSNSNFTAAKFKNTDAGNTIFKGALFTETTLGRSDFYGADFSGAKFLRTRFGDANLENANFTGAVFVEADLSDVMGLKPGQLRLACGEEKTKLPEGFTLQPCIENQDLMMKMQEKAKQIKRARSQAARKRMQREHDQRTMIAARPFAHDKAFSEAMDLIDQSLRELPPTSPTHKRLMQAREKLTQLEAIKPQ